jgi:uncharacterized protein YbaR (Trm112 family)
VSEMPAVVSQDLLDILRCPVCVHNEPEGGELIHLVNWLICRDCERKYPIRDDIPVMLIDEGDRFRGTPVDQLPSAPPERQPELAGAEALMEKRDRLPLLLMGTAGLLLGLFLAWVLWERKGRSPGK